ncbi:hypothetical protein ACNJRW_01720 [Stenotrophomonas maltophilia]|uniref:hypothetical protein n=1 Tax=Gammaproteobacteria TaxID=1236 RepID=UPI000C265C26|nr:MULTISPECIES: hypothetical protein [Stenotrophomonas]MBH1571792.1 hypothetical protein [Stenotrophomonas maltophilia]MCF3545397.1 hypothetical protein [Stenotrophomonas maltophilia]MCI1156808.1 hypothetical protein [Stenotrophomonas maltophilia]PJL44276.1 hypothetical protein B9Y56_06135 [Stenotrophomonas maltophilia]
MTTFMQLVYLTFACLLIYYVPFLTARCFIGVRRAYKADSPMDAEVAPLIVGLLMGWILLLACLAKVIDTFVNEGPLGVWVLSFYLLVNAWRFSVGLQEVGGDKK